MKKISIMIVTKGRASNFRYHSDTSDIDISGTDTSIDSQINDKVGNMLNEKMGFKPSTDEIISVSHTIY